MRFLMYSPAVANEICIVTISILQMTKQMQGGLVICQRLKLITRFGLLFQCCFTPELELLTMHCSFSYCPAWPHNTLRRRLNMKQHLAAFQSVNTFIMRCTKRAGRLDSLCSTKEYGQIHVLTSNLLGDLATPSQKIFLTSQLLFLKTGPLVDRVKRQQRKYIFPGCFILI